MKRFLITCFLTLSLALVALVAAQTGDLPTLDDLDDDWLIVPVEGAVCSRGTPYQFFVRRGTSENLMIYFQGGGACWNALTCREGGAFDDSVNDDEFARYDGIFNLTNAENPVADYSMVFVPYCTADIHSGANSMDYTRDIRIEHNGYANAAAVLDWVYATFDAPEKLFITGSSAGAYGAIYHAPFIINQYPEADAVVLGDAGIGITPIGWDVLLDNWDIYANMPDFVPALANADPDTFTASLLYSANAEHSPDARIAQFTHHADSVQVLFYTFSDFSATTADWIDGMYSALSALDELPNFTSYVAPGDEHTILAYPEFYTLTVEGIAFRDWLVALLDGDVPDSVRCVACDGVE